MRFPTLTTAAFLAWLHRGQGRGAQTETGMRGAELEAFAESASAGALAIADAAEQFFPRTVDTMLDEIEEAWGLTAAAAGRTTAQRIKRLRAAAMMRSRQTEERIAHILGTFVLDEIAEVGDGTTLDRVTVEEASFANTEAEGTLLAFLRNPLHPSNGLARGAPHREALVDLLRTWLPARSIARTGRDFVDRLLTDDNVAIWNSAARTIGAASLSQQTTDVRDWGRPPARAVSYHPGMRVDADQLNAAQDATLWGTINPDAAWTGGPTGRAVFLVWDLGIGAIANLDTGIDWRSRYVYFAGRHFGTNDYRPGNANDNLGNGSTKIAAFGFTKAAAVINLTGGGTITCTVGAAGELQINNMSGAASRGWVLAWAPGAATGGSGLSRIQTFADGDTMAALDAALMTSWWNAAATFRSTAGQAWASYAGDGGLHRVACVVLSAGVAKVVDASCDWRDRLVVLRRVAQGSADGVILGGDDDGLSAIANASPIPFYSGAGATDRTGSWAVQDPLSGVWYYARSSDGALMVETESPGSGSVVALFLVDATERAGQRTTSPELVSTGLVVDATDVEPAPLNAVQDAACLDQVTGERRRTSFDPSVGWIPTASEAYPLGRIVHGTPPIPEEWLVRHRFGEADAVDSTTRFQRRQSMVRGRARFPFAVSVGPGSTYVLDAVRDWRDRFAWATGYYSTSDIRPTKAADGDINTGATGARWEGARYFGPGGTSYRLLGTVAGTLIRLEADATTGQLKLSHDSGSTVYVVGWIEGTDILGPRSVPRLPF